MLRKHLTILGCAAVLTLTFSAAQAKADRVTFRFRGGPWSHSTHRGWHRYWGGPSIGFYYAPEPVYIVDGYEDARYYDGPDFWYSDPSFGFRIDLGGGGYRYGGRDHDDHYRYRSNDYRRDRNGDRDHRGYDHGYSGGYDRSNRDYRGDRGYSGRDNGGSYFRGDHGSDGGSYRRTGGDTGSSRDNGGFRGGSGFRGDTGSGSGSESHGGGRGGFGSGSGRSNGGDRGSQRSGGSVDGGSRTYRNGESGGSSRGGDRNYNRP